MRRILPMALLLSGVLAITVRADEPAAFDAATKKAAQLEAQLGKLKSNTPEAAPVLLELIELYRGTGNVFGLIRASQTFTAAHTQHPKHAEAMVKLLDGLRATSRNKEIIVTARQFLSRYPNDPQAGAVEQVLADTLNRTPDRDQAATAYKAIWDRQKANDAGKRAATRAVQIWSAMNTAPMSQKAAELAEAVMDALPAGEACTEFGEMAGYEWERGQEWIKSNQASAKLLKKSPPTDKARLKVIHYRMGENYARANQRANAVESFKAAVALGIGDDSGTLGRVIQELHHLQAKPAEIEPVVAQFMQKYPTRDERYTYRGYVGHAYLRAMNKPAALQVFAECLPFDARGVDQAGYYAREQGPMAVAQTEQVLRDAISKNPRDAFYLRYILAFEVLQNQKKDPAAAKTVLREFLDHPYPADGHVNNVIATLLGTAANDAEFEADLKRAIKPGLPWSYVRGYLLAWAEQAAKAKESASRATKVRQTVAAADRDASMIGWAQLASGDRTQLHKARTYLLAPERFAQLNDEQVRAILGGEAHDYRHGAYGNQHAKSVGLFARLAARFPTDWQVAYSWAEATLHYNDATKTPEVDRECVTHLLKQQLPIQHPESWRLAVQIAGRTKDAAFVKQAFAWVQEQQKKTGFHPTYTTTIADVLDAVGMKAEAEAYLKHAVPIDRDHYETAGAVWRLAARIEKLADRLKFLQDQLPAFVGTDSHGPIAQYVAHELQAAKDFVGFDKVIREFLARKAEKPFRGSGFDAYTPYQWVHNIRNDMMAKPADKRLALTAIRDLRVSPSTAMATLALFELPDAPAMNPTDRLLTFQAATLTVDDNSTSWDWLMPFVQELLTRKDYPAAATVATGMLSNISNVDAGRKKTGLDLVRQSYARMGGLGLNVDENSPLAPLFQAALYLRLGDERLALETYTANKKLFDEHRNEVPVDLILFVCDSHIAAGGDDNFNRAEDILRGWLVKNGDAKEIDDTTKAKVQLLLARTYFKAQRYDVARTEFQSVMNRYAKTPQAVEAEFGIGESFMAQKVYDQAQQVFERLANSTERDIVIRAEFLRGVLASRRGDRDEARQIFKGVLERVPSIELANEVLFNLAEVYGAEQRYIDQLELLRTVGRLGRTSKRFHTPGMPLSIVVQDSDLGISRGHAKIPVKVTTVPGGDEEIIYLRSGGAGKGLFRADLETRLGKVQKNDRVLQLSGNDTIKCDYPDEFKAEFKSVPLPDAEIKVASTGKLEASSSKILDAEEEGFAARLQREANEGEEADRRRSLERPKNQIKPGNLVYLRVQDADRDLTDEPDKVTVKVVAASGDQVQVQLVETGPHTGVFEGTVKTGELPAGALASDAALDHSPLMAIDKDEKTFWLSQPDGATPKWLAVDMKDLKPVDRAVFTFPNPTNQVPVRATIEGSDDGRFWFRLASVPPVQPVPPVAGEFGRMTLRLYAGNYAGLSNWQQVVDLSKNAKPVETTAADQLTWALPETDDKRNTKSFAAIWHGKLVQPRAGAARIKLDGAVTGLVIDGKPELPIGPGGRTVDVYLEAGLHDLTVFAAGSGTGFGATWARANQNAATVVLAPFEASDFDLTDANLKPAELRAPPEGIADGATWDFKFAPTELRHVRMMIHEYKGEAVAISNVILQNTAENKTYIPPAQDVLALANNDVLEMAAGDTITANYVDEVTESVDGGSRLLTATLTATYYNAITTPIAYDFVKSPNGAIQNIRKELMRIDPGERIIFEVTDFDQDRTAKPDTIKITVAVNDGKPIEMTAQETDENTGVFTKEVDTTAGSEEGKLTVKPGDKVFLRYLDEQNTFPGHPVIRESVVYVSQPSEGRIRILDSRVIPPPNGVGNPRITYTGHKDEKRVSQVAFEAPLTVEVIDKDAAKDARSKVTVQLTTSDGANIELECAISSAYAPVIPGANVGARQTQWALSEGRFIGQVILQLGSKNSPDIVPLTANMPRGLIGGAKLPKEQEEENERQLVVTRVLNVSGKDTIEATYVDEKRPNGKAEKLTAKGRLIANGVLQATDSEYKKPVTALHVGERLYLMVTDADLDQTDERDTAKVEITTDRGEKETIELMETLAHSGVFTGSVQLKPNEKPTPGNLDPANPAIECYFGDKVKLTYLDESASTETGKLELTLEIQVVIGTDGLVTAFSKAFNDEKLAVESQFLIAESYFELFKSHKTLNRENEQKSDLEAGRRILREVMQDYPNPKYVPRIAYLLGQFSQELQQWNEAIDAYQLIVRQYADYSLAADAQYKLAQCYEEAGDFDQALEAYVTLAATYPKSPLIANVMLRISEHFYKKENYKVAAQVGEKFLERFEGHKFAPKMAFRVGQCYYKDQAYVKAGESFDKFAKMFADDALASDALFWSGESFRMAKNNFEAFKRYNKCRWDFPSSEAAKYARGRLALPEMLQQFENAANLDNDK